MEYILLILSISAIHLLAVMSPGPDFMVAVKNSLSYGKKIWIYTALGFAGGIWVHITYSLFWIALIISQSILLFTLIKYLWAAYLIYIWIMSLRAKKSKIDIIKQENWKNITSFQAFKIWFLTNVLNPKATLFFLSLFTLVISPETPTLILLIISFIMIFNTFLWFSLLSLFFTQSSVRKVFLKFEIFFNRVFWTLLIALGLRVAMIER